MGTTLEGVPCLVRTIGRSFVTKLPPADEWEKVLNAGYDYDIEPYDDFAASFDINETYPPQIMVESYRARIEGVFGLICNSSLNATIDPRANCTSLHNGIHAYIGGSIVVAPSAIDPVFFLLHNWIDAMWALYQDKYGLEYTFPEQYKLTQLFDNGHFNGLEINSMDVMDVAKLGYVYQIQVAHGQESDSWWTMRRTIGLSTGIALVAIILCVVCLWCVNKRKHREGYAESESTYSDYGLLGR